MISAIHWQFKVFYRRLIEIMRQRLASSHPEQPYKIKGYLKLSGSLWLIRSNRLFPTRCTAQVGVAADNTADAGGGIIVYVHKRYLHFGFAQFGRLFAAA